MINWRSLLRYDPVQPLLSLDYSVIQYFTRHDLLGETVGPIEELWDHKESRSLLRRQLDDGSWKYPGKNPEKYPDVNYGLVETFKHLRLLVGKYGLDRSHPVIDRAVEYMFSCQTDEGISGGYMPASITPTTAAPSWSTS